MTLIGITCRTFELDNAGGAAHGARPVDIAAIIAAGGTPFLIPHLAEESAIRELYNLAGGILLAGGEDVDPALYGEKPSLKLGKVDRKRDALECTLAKWAAEDKKPLLGICRGVQVMNVALGGSLYQDIPSEVTTETVHSDQRAPSHSLAIQPSSKLSEIVEASELIVNSLHHQSLKKVASRLVVTGKSDDGIIEAVEIPGHPFYIGVQCHPELMCEVIDVRWQKLYRQFVSAAARHKSK
jgi:putative glutamine amidotransferase